VRRFPNLLFPSLFAINPYYCRGGHRDSILIYSSKNNRTMTLEERSNGAKFFVDVLRGTTRVPKYRRCSVAPDKAVKTRPLFVFSPQVCLAPVRAVVNILYTIDPSPESAEFVIKKREDD